MLPTRIAVRCAALLLSSSLAVAAQPVTNAAPVPADGKPGQRASRTQVRVQYADRVEGLFDLTYALMPGYRPLDLDLFRVANSPPRPLVVFVHGGGYESGGRRAFSSLWGDMDKLMAQIAAHGYVVAAISYRLSGEAKFPAQLDDAKSAIRWLRANAGQYGIDSRRVAIWGESVGGSLAALVGTTCGVRDLEGRGPNPDQSSCVQAVIDWYGATDMNQLDAQAPPNAKIIHNSPDSNQSKVLGCVLHFECPASVVNRANPLAYVDASDVNVPFLIMHGDADTAVSYKQSQILYDALRSMGVPAQFELLAGVNHNFEHATPEQAQHIMDVSYRFLAQALGGSTK